MRALYLRQISSFVLVASFFFMCSSATAQNLSHVKPENTFGYDNKDGAYKASEINQQQTVWGKKEEVRANNGKVNGPPPPPPSMGISISDTCGSATAHLVPFTVLDPNEFNYTWRDENNNIVGQSLNSPDTINTVNNLFDGSKYSLIVQWFGLTDTITVYDTVYMDCVHFTHANDTAICAGQHVLLWTGTVQGSTGVYGWLPGGSNAPSVLVAPDTTTTYTVVYTPTNGLPRTANITVTVIPAPVITVHDTTVCRGSHAVLTGIPSVPGGTYSWSPGGSSNSSITVTPQNTSTYTVTYVSTCGTATSSGTVSVPPAPVLTFANDTICSTDSVNICAPSGYAAYHWNSGETSACIYAKHASDYYLTTTDNGNCSDTTNHVRVFNYPTSALVITRKGDDTLVTSTGFTNYKWYFNDTLISDADTNSTIAQQSGNYKVTCIDSNGCTRVSGRYAITLTGFNEVTIEAGIKVFPNPSSGNWNLVVGDNLIGSQVEIFDGSGRMVYAREILNEHSEILLNESKGVYILHVISNSKTFNLKLIRL